MAQDKQTYSTRLPKKTAEQIEEYREQNDLTKSEAVARAVQRGMNEPTGVEKVFANVAEISLTSGLLLLTAFGVSLVGQILNLLTGVATIYFIVFGPLGIIISSVLYYALQKGYARRLGIRLEKGGGLVQNNQ
jgi:hypothetical protein